MVDLSEQSLHRSLQDPVLESIEAVKEIAARFPDVISFALGSPYLINLDDLDISHYINRYLVHLCRERNLAPHQARRLLYDYGPSRGLINDLVSDILLSDYGIEAEPESVVITVGAQEAMLLALRAICCSPDDLLGLINPTFYGIIGAARVLDVGIVPIRGNDNGLDIEHLKLSCEIARANGKRIRTVYVAPDFANPSGTVMDVPTRHKLLAIAEQQDMLLLEDNAYGFTAAPTAEMPTLKSLDKNGRVLYIGTFAKIFMPGARVGYVVADQIVRMRDGRRRPLASKLALIKCMTTVNTSPICQAIVGGMILEHGGSFASLSQSKSLIYRQNLTLLLEALDRYVPTIKGVTWNHPAGGFFVQMRIPVPADTALLELSASRYGVLWTPLFAFYVDRAGTNFLRLSCGHLDPFQIEVGVTKLARFLCEIASSEHLVPARFA